MRWKLLFAFLFLAAGLALAGYFEYCFSRSGPSTVSVPILVSPAHITSKFFAYTSARYRIGVAFDETEKLVVAKPDSIADPDSRIPTRLKASWTVSRGSRVIQHGSASEAIWRVQGQPFLEFGGFQAEAWQWHQLDVDAISYETRLAQANPRLTVGIWTEKASLYEPEFLAFKFATRIIYGLCLFIGGLLILSSLVACRETLFAPLR
jgi:hypothetical protein